MKNRWNDPSDRDDLFTLDELTAIHHEAVDRVRAQYTAYLGGRGELDGMARYDAWWTAINGLVMAKFVGQGCSYGIQGLFLNDPGSAIEMALEILMDLERPGPAWIDLVDRELPSDVIDQRNAVVRSDIARSGYDTAGSWERGDAVIMATLEEREDASGAGWDDGLDLDRAVELMILQEDRAMVEAARRRMLEFVDEAISRLLAFEPAGWQSPVLTEALEALASVYLWGRPADRPLDDWKRDQRFEAELIVTAKLGFDEPAWQDHLDYFFPSPY